MVIALSIPALVLATRQGCAQSGTRPAGGFRSCVQGYDGIACESKGKWKSLSVLRSVD